MRLKWLFLSLFVLSIVGCSRKEEIKPQPVQSPPVTPAVFSLASVLQSNMVVQRDKPFRVWGQARAGLKISVASSWNANAYNTVADRFGSWSITIPASPATSAPQTIAIKPDGLAALTLSNILIGDVWVCAGQSNMVMPVDSIAPFRGVLDYRQEIGSANYPNIRMLSIPYDPEDVPATMLKFAANWAACSPATVGKMSAVAYFFAQKLNLSLNVPIGIIISANNGSYCQDWANSESMATDALLAALYSGSSLYNGMVNPLTNLSIKGFAWYQGENNQHDSPPSNYTLLNSALIQGWRGKFNDPALPFYYVQMTPFAEDYNSTIPVGGDLTSNYYARFREAQANILAVPTTGMAITMDVGEADNHHPRNKKPVGERLALHALKNTYSQNVECYGPQYSSFSANGYTATINFIPGTANGLNVIDNAPLKQYFFIAGTDHVFRQGTAAISGSSIVISAPANTPLPIQAVRYAFTNAPVTNLQNSAGLPAEPFRTDNWSN